MCTVNGLIAVPPLALLFIAPKPVELLLEPKGELEEAPKADPPVEPNAEVVLEPNSPPELVAVLLLALPKMLLVLLLEPKADPVLVLEPAPKGEVLVVLAEPNSPPEGLAPNTEPLLLFEAPNADVAELLLLLFPKMDPDEAELPVLEAPKDDPNPPNPEVVFERPNICCFARLFLPLKAVQITKEEKAVYQTAKSTEFFGKFLLMLFKPAGNCVARTDTG